jgi:putative transposase
MQQNVAIKSLPQAIEILQEMNVEGYSYPTDYRQAARLAIADLLESRMQNRIDSYLDDLARRGGVDRRNGSYTRHLLTEIGDIELCIPRTRKFNPVTVIEKFARRAPQVERLIMACFLLGLSTRKVSKALLPILGERISPSTVSRVAKVLDSSVASFHKRRLGDVYRVLLLDGVNLKRKTGAGSINRPVLVAMGIRPDGKKEIIDFYLAPGESEAAWTFFLGNLYHRGLTGDRLNLICVDGGKGMRAALEMVYQSVPIQRCWAHKTRNILNKARKDDQPEMKSDLHEISHAKNRTQARKAARTFADSWSDEYPKAVNCLRDDLDDLLQFFAFKDKKWRQATRTTNAIEREFVEVRRRTRPMGVFYDKASIQRILFAIFMHHNQQQGIAHPFPLA